MTNKKLKNFFNEPIGKFLEIGESAFENCTSIAALVIQPSEGSLTIGNQAFYGKKISGSLIILPRANKI